MEALAQGSTVATLLPGAEFSTRAEWPDARRLIDAGATVALSTDCNPGSSFTSSMPFCIALAVRDMGMTPDEAIWSATAGGAAALRRRDIGVVREGARADLTLLSSWSYLPAGNLITEPDTCALRRAEVDDGKADEPVQVWVVRCEPCQYQQAGAEQREDGGQEGQLGLVKAL